MTDVQHIKQKLLDYVQDGGAEIPTVITDAGVDAIPLISEISRADLPIDLLERLEVVLKAILTDVTSAGISGPKARKLAVAMRDVGLMFKYKPYAVKASSPLGYSIFLQRPSEGFSFQCHLEHKTEVFHILEVLDGGYVFLCTLADWRANYDAETFSRWLDGEGHPFFDRCRFHPNPGDVFVISELGIVHTVIGCTLEEYATASTDMVERLHDQNDRNAVPAFPRDTTLQKLGELSLPATSRNVELLAEEITYTAIPIQSQDWGERTVMTDSFVKASYARVSPSSSLPFETDDRRAVFLRIFDGDCELTLRSRSEEEDADIPAISLAAGETTTIPPGIGFQIRNKSADGRLQFSEHRIEPSIAFV